ncbi:MAG: putative Ser/Thr phosphatase family protein, partial [Streblomastix strix]
MIIPSLMMLGMLLKSIKFRFLTCISADYMTSIGCLFPFIIILEIVFGISSSAHQYAWIVCFAIIGVIIVYLLISHLNGTFVLRDKYIELKNIKIKQPFRIVHISDVHIGSRSQSFLEKVVNRVNELNGDIICITGDLIDSHAAVSEQRSDVDKSQISDISQLQPQTYPILRSLEKLTAKLGVFFVIGNHDVMVGKESVFKMIQHFPNIRLLSNEYVDIPLQESNSSDQNINQSNSLRIIGFDDGQSDQFTNYVNDFFTSNSSQFQNETSDSPYTIVMHHQPHKGAWLKAMDLLHGDLFLAGHTHNGQIFPVFPLVYLMFPHSAGLLTINKKNEQTINQQSEVDKQEQFHSFDRHLYVNPGTGTWGTPARS